jgi:hypothetical protein
VSKELSSFPTYTYGRQKEKEMRSADSESVWHGAGSADYRDGWRTAIDGNNRQFCRYTRPENIKHFEYREVCE